MAIIDCQLHWFGSTGTHLMPGPEYTAVWRVTTDDYQEQSQTVILWFRANQVDLGDVYQYAGDTSVSVAVCERIRATRYKETRDVWEVVVSYSTPNEEDGLDEDGNVNPDPLEWRPQIFVNTVQYQKLVEESTFLGGYHGAALLGIPVGHKTIPMNSAFVPFEPGEEKDDSRMTIRIVRNFAEWDGNEADEVVDTVNAERFVFNYKGLILECEARTCKIREWSASLRRHNGVDYWESDLAMDRDRDTWVREIADRGFHARALPGDADGRGGTYSGADFIPGVPHVRRLVDDDETPISTPVLLDGNGQPLDTSVGLVEPVYGKWLHYDEFMFSKLNQLEGLINT